MPPPMTPAPSTPMRGRSVMLRLQRARRHVDPDLAVDHAHREARDRPAVGVVRPTTRAHVELPEVQRAGDHRPLELPLVERRARVRAGVLHGVDLAADPVQADLDPGDAHAQTTAVGDLALTCDALHRQGAAQSTGTPRRCQLGEVFAVERDGAPLAHVPVELEADRAQRTAQPQSEHELRAPRVRTAALAPQLPREAARALQPPAETRLDRIRAEHLGDRVAPAARLAESFARLGWDAGGDLPWAAARSRAKLEVWGQLDDFSQEVSCPGKPRRSRLHASRRAAGARRP